MTSGRFVTRGIKTRMFGVACCLLVLCALVFVFHDTQSELEVTRADLNRCSQIKESLHVQLQGMVDYKIKLENSLSEEKTKHKNELEKLEANIIQQKITIENIKRNSLEMHKDVSASLQKIEKEHKDLQNKYEEESNKRIDLEKLNDVLENKNTELLKDIRRIMINNEELLQKSKTCTNEPIQGQDKKEESGKGAKLMHGNKAEFIQGSLLNGSTTPFINPQAVSVDQEEQLRQSLKTITPVSKVDNGVAQPMQIPLGQHMSQMAEQLKSALNMGGAEHAQVAEENVLNGGVQVDYNEMKAVLAPPGGFNDDTKDDNAANEQIDEKQDKKIEEKKDNKPVDPGHGFIPAPPGLETLSAQKPQEEVDREPKNQEIPRNLKNDYQGGEYDKEDDEPVRDYMDNDVQVAADTKPKQSDNLQDIEGIQLKT